MQPDVIASRYRVVRAVGQGGMGTVWLCTDETLHRDVAVKQMGSLPGESPGDTARAMREARLAAALNHKNAVSIYDVVEHDGSTWLVMEYVPSQTLSQLVASEGRLPYQRVAHIGAQVAAALDSAHSLGIVHRDVKPGNILVGEDDTAKISDFGIARGRQDLQLTQTGMVTGTPSCFAPELARGDEPTFASDVWALGITLYTAAEGSPPYEPQSNPLAMLSIITREPLPPPVHAGPLTGVLAGMLEPDATQRATMADTLDGLREVERGDATTRSWGSGSVAASAPAATERPEATSSFESPTEERAEPAYEKPVAAPAAAGSWSDGRDDDRSQSARDRSPLGRLAMAALALFVLVGAGALLWNTIGLGGGGEADPSSTNLSDSTNAARGKSPEAPTAESTGSSSTDEPDPSDEPTLSSTPTSSTPTSSTLTTSEESTTQTTAPPSSGDPEAFTEAYFATVTGNTDAGWSMLSPSYQQELGRGSYDGFWGGIESVDLGSVEADGDTVTYEITYTRTDGSTSEETKQLTLQPSGDSYLIANDVGL